MYGSTSKMGNIVCRLRSIATHRDHFIRRPSVCLSVCHTFLSHFPKLCFAGDACILRNAATIFEYMYRVNGLSINFPQPVAFIDYNLSSCQCSTTQSECESFGASLMILLPYTRRHSICRALSEPSRCNIPTTAILHCGIAICALCTIVR